MHGNPLSHLKETHEPETEDYRDIVLKENLPGSDLPENWDQDE
jgi:hypothetical protein